MKLICITSLVVLFNINLYSQTTILDEKQEVSSKKVNSLDALKLVDDDFLTLKKYALNSDKSGRNVAIFTTMIILDEFSTNWMQQDLYPVSLALKDLLPLPDLYGDIPVLDNWAPGIDGWIYSGLVVSYGLGHILERDQYVEAAILSTKSIAEGYIVSHLILKSIFGRQRPKFPLNTNQADYDSSAPFSNSSFDFFNFHRPYFHSNHFGTALPSYHWTMYFSIASVYSKTFNDSPIPYFIAGSVGLYQLSSSKHWVSDIILGAVIGEYIGKAIYENHHKSDLISQRKSKKRLRFSLSRAHDIYVTRATITF